MGSISIGRVNVADRCTYWVLWVNEEWGGIMVEMGKWGHILNSE